VIAAVALAATVYSTRVADGIVLRDLSTHRAIPIKLYYPIGAGPFPFIVVSPGFGGTQESYGYLGQAWAKAGFVVGVVTHAGSDREALFEYGATIARDPAASFAQQVDRTADVSFAISSIPAIEALVPDLKREIDSGRVGVAGHSMGAGTALLIAGASAGASGAAPADLSDHRVSAAIAMSPQGPGEEGFHDGSWSGITIPVMTMSGTLDFGIDGQSPSWRQQAFQDMRGSNKFQVTVNGAKHLSFALGGMFAGCIIQETVAFWDRYLLGNEASIESDGACAVSSK
jgi:predicted dienelactone hydrolase